ncbi:MAG: 4Fe-4S binding protein [Candidatus Bathyarchaeia archaeon]
MQFAGLTGDIGGAKTGSWRSMRPVFDHGLCTECGTCAMYCPDGVVYQTDEGYYETDYDYCKGCGICANECPAKAIEMVRETEALRGGGDMNA